MLEESATVLSIDGDYAEVRTERRTTCGDCSAKSTCGTGAIAKYLGNRHTQIRALNSIGASKGEQVIVGVSDEVLTTVSFHFYIMPLVTLFLGALVGQWVGDQFGLVSMEPLSIIGGLLGLAVGIGLLSRYSKKQRNNTTHQVVILRRANVVNLTNSI